jgi:hypothetical protein
MVCDKNVLQGIANMKTVLTYFIIFQLWGLCSAGYIAQHLLVLKLTFSIASTPGSASHIHNTKIKGIRVHTSYEKKQLSNI